ncbi:endosome/lysosome-associated apoptosis and autophagy regulator family member 2 isoform X1 [Protopterus annectens]|uniref:endosome/lysosome-associated apoptosis and autophagy regulator family member 2 isoform X1 n=2 Tax=Protopterus annectens TaxID=7888 RepID=UPI001CFB507F|nr:endosome/lysosome-associated apoptosis and autophagy regulator family member 2 isoform X1 [Protopterus annectens]
MLTRTAGGGGVAMVVLSTFLHSVRLWSLLLCTVNAADILMNTTTVAGPSSPSFCKEADYHFEYTECDSTGSRWRVAVPNSNRICNGLPPPVRGKECTFSCAAGEYLDIMNQVCSKCNAGTYSLGSGIRFDEWDNIPSGFSLVATFLDSPTGASSSNEGSCINSTWIPRGNFIESNRDDCTVSLVYAVHLKKSGPVSFEYQYPDKNIYFEFFIQNDQCQEMESLNQKWMQVTDHGEWRMHTVTLKSGTNILYWRTTGILLGSKVATPVLLKNITIEGVAYTSECSPCKPGTFSKNPGSSSCDLCPANTYSRKGAKECMPCNVQTQYSDAGSNICKERPACTSADIFQLHTPCDEEGKTQITYKWIEPKICRDDIKGSFQLPLSNEKKPCPPCNPGFYNDGSPTCSPCKPGTYSNGTHECKPCPAGTEPALGFEYKWWNILPSNMKTSCFNVGNTKCNGMNGWEVAGDHIQSAAGSTDNDYLILNLHISGFRPPAVSANGVSGNEIGRISFIFETICSADCELYFMLDTNKKNTVVVESWEGTKSKRMFTHVITKNSSVSFTWAFQRTSQTSTTRRFINDIVKIDYISITNVVDGVASYCENCAINVDQSGSSCVPCPAGHYIEKGSNQCKECPPNTFLSPHQVFGKEACIPCGPGSKSSKDRSFCFSDCAFTYRSKNQTLIYDFRSFSTVYSLINGPSFTTKGTKYFHNFNISLCGNEGKKMAVCVDNVTDLTTKAMEGESGGYADFVETYVCQSTIIPSDGRGFKTALSSQSVSLADTFIGVSVESHLKDVEILTNLFPQSSVKVPDVNFFYKSSVNTSSCPYGRATVISLRCKTDENAQGKVSVSSKCPGGTCDGCTFYFLWESADACPLCTSDDYHEIEGACRGGIQEILYVWNETKHCTKGVALPEKRQIVCESIDFWLKAGAGVGAFTAVLLIALTCYFWKKNKKLEYKYSKLVMTAGTKDCELPVADSCAIMEGEDNEEDVVYSNKPSLLKKLKSLATKEKEDIFESVQLKSSRSQNI